MKKTLILIVFFTAIAVISYYVADAFPSIVRN
jgi:hypothetical protein